MGAVIMMLIPTRIVPANLYKGMRMVGSRTDASRIRAASVCRSFASWVLRFNARGLDGLVTMMKSPGAPWASSTTDHRPRHWRRLLRPARSRRSTACALAAQGPGAVALGDRSP